MPVFRAQLTLRSLIPPRGNLRGEPTVASDDLRPPLVSRCLKRHAPFPGLEIVLPENLGFGFHSP